MSDQLEVRMVNRPHGGEGADADDDERYGSILDHLKEGFQVISPDFRYLYVNDAVVTHARVDREELLGRRMNEVYPGIDQTPMYGVIERCMAQRDAAEFENEFTYPDGSKAWFELRIEPVPEGVAILSVDITDRKRLELELEARRAELAASRRMLQEVTYAAAHDLQTPLRHMLFLSDPEASQPGSLESLCRVHAAATLMHERLAALVAYTEAERAEPARRVDVEVLVEQVLGRLRPLIAETGARVQTRFDVSDLELSPGALATAAREFLRNALTFFTPGVPPQISLRVRLARGRCTLTVSDEGIGIDEQHTGSIWQAFYRIREAGAYPGLGVGLARTRVTVEAAGGEVAVQSTPGEGSTFSVHLPARAPAD